MNDKLPSREQALEFLIRAGCSDRVLRHCQAVAELALETAQTLKAKGQSINVRLVEVGALLHDIGRSRTHSVNHAIEGAKIAKNLGLPKPIVFIIERHVGGGVTEEEAKELGWPTNDGYMPKTLEEKVVSYADKLIESGKRAPVELTIEKLIMEGKPEAAQRVRRLHDEIIRLLRTE